ncbi:hypothetical protein PENTCL1PPCAC_10166, partial [Pristionchus entomophagus]
ITGLLNEDAILGVVCRRVLLHRAVLPGQHSTNSMMAEDRSVMDAGSPLEEVTSSKRSTRNGGEMSSSLAVPASTSETPSTMTNSSGKIFR